MRDRNATRNSLISIRNSILMKLSSIQNSNIFFFIHIAQFISSSSSQNLNISISWCWKRNVFNQLFEKIEKTRINSIIHRFHVNEFHTFKITFIFLLVFWIYCFNCWFRCSHFKSISSSREFTSFSKTIKTRKKCESKFHQSKIRRQRNSTLKITTK